jgi:hypothetical protein
VPVGIDGTFKIEFVGAAVNSLLGRTCAPSVPPLRVLARAVPGRLTSGLPKDTPFESCAVPAGVDAPCIPGELPMDLLSSVVPVVTGAAVSTGGSATVRRSASQSISTGLRVPKPFKLATPGTVL